jgi:hypothetical protein
MTDGWKVTLRVADTLEVRRWILGYGVQVWGVGGGGGAGGVEGGDAVGGGEVGGEASGEAAGIGSVEGK